MGKIITIEGTDCSGKETQSKMLIEKLSSLGYKVKMLSMPFYDSPTGKIIAGPYLAKFGEGYFEEGATKVSPYVASLYYTADRAYNKERLLKVLAENDFVILDRYMFSNLAHQGSKIEDKKEREKFLDFMDKLELEMLKLPKSDFTFFLHMPTEVAIELRKHRQEKADQHEKDVEHLKKAENMYIELCDRYDIEKIECAKDGKPKTIEEINDELLKKLVEKI